MICTVKDLEHEFVECSGFDFGLNAQPCFETSFLSNTNNSYFLLLSFSQHPRSKKMEEWSWSSVDKL
jgi:hypothetical protein